MATPIGNGTYFGTTTGATQDGTSTLCGVSAASPDVWYAYTNATAVERRMTVDTLGTGTDYDTILAAFDACGGTELACNDDCNDDPCGLESAIRWSIPPGATHLIRVSGYNGLTGNFQLNVASAAEFADQCAAALSVHDGTYFGTTIGATNDGAASCGVSASSPDVWYAYTNLTASPLLVRADTIGGTNYDTVLSAHDGCGGAQLVCNDNFYDFDNGDFIPESRIAWVVPAGATHLIRVSGFNGAAGDFQLDVDSVTLAANNECDLATAVGEGIFTGDLGGATGSTGDDSSCAVDLFGSPNDTIDVWYAYTPSASGTATITTCSPGTQFDTVLSVFDGCGGMELACNDDAVDPSPACALSNVNLLSKVELSVTAATVYLVRVSVYNDQLPGAFGTGSLYELSITLPQPTACPCDLDGAPGVNIFDLLAYLGLWFPMNPAADVNRSGGVDIFDLLDFLACWFPASAGNPCP